MRGPLFLSAMSVLRANIAESLIPFAGGPLAAANFSLGRETEEDEMRKTASVAIIIGLLVGAFAVPAEAAKKKKARVFKGTYMCPCGVQVLGQGPGFRLGSGEGGFEVPVLPKERFMSLEITDDSGLPVYFNISQDVDGDGTLYEHEAGTGCGKTTEPAELVPGASVVVFLYSGTCDVGVALATGGSFTATLSAKP